MIGDKLKFYGALAAFVLSATGAGVMAFGWGGAAHGRDVALRERDMTTTWAENACTSIGSYYKTYSPKTGKLLARAEWGKACADDIRRLAAREVTKATEALGIVASHNDDQAAKRATDATAARRSSTRDHNAQQKLEAAHAAAQDDFYGPGWFDALSDALGLHAHDPETDALVQSAAAGAAGDRAEGGTLGGPAAVRGEAGPVLGSGVGADEAGNGRPAQ